MLSNDDEERALLELNGLQNIDMVTADHPLTIQSRRVLKGKVDDTKAYFNDRLTRILKTKSTPDINHGVSKESWRSKESRISIDSKPYTKELCFGQMLPCEDRVTEYKRGTGHFLRNTLVQTIRKYICAFLNSEGECNLVPSAVICFTVFVCMQ